MSNPTANKRKGAKAETDAVAWLRQRGYRVERLRLNGREDEGDLVIDYQGILYVLEVKDWQDVELGVWTKQAFVEAENYAKHRGLDGGVRFGVLHKRRGTLNVGHWYFTTLFYEWLDQVDDAGVPF